jgi:hypothetical protein
MPGRYCQRLEGPTEGALVGNDLAQHPRTAGQPGSPVVHCAGLVDPTAARTVHERYTP